SGIEAGRLEFSQAYSVLATSIVEKAGVILPSFTAGRLRGPIRSGLTYAGEHASDLFRLQFEIETRQWREARNCRCGGTAKLLDPSEAYRKYGIQ
ncbi:MAG: hypothetical protein MN733_39380, partial [Nitrososphaera sp.]|nr:hypothetical protein [Nitrososphaera sp.]